MASTLSPTEINRKVAEICGDENRHDWEFVGGNVYGSFYVCKRCNGTSSEEDGPPNDECLRDFYHDANAAHWAAERAFGDVSTHTMHQGIRGYFCTGTYYETATIQGDSIPAAICLAILARKDHP